MALSQNCHISIVVSKLADMFLFFKRYLCVTAKSLAKSGRPRRLGYSYRRNLKERFIEAVLFLMAFASVAITLAIVAMLVKESYAFFQHVSIWDF